MSTNLCEYKLVEVLLYIYKTDCGTHPSGEVSEAAETSTLTTTLSLNFIHIYIFNICIINKNYTNIINNGGLNLPCAVIDCITLILQARLVVPPGCASLNNC